MGSACGGHSLDKQRSVRDAERSAAINRLRVDDRPLDRHAADTGAAMVSALGVSVADAHLASVLRTTPGPHAVLTSDKADVRRIAAHVGAAVNIVVV